MNLSNHTGLTNQTEIKKEMKQETSEERENEENLGVSNSGLREWLNSIVLTVGFILSYSVVALLPSHYIMKNSEFSAQSTDWRLLNFFGRNFVTVVAISCKNA